MKITIPYVLILNLCSLSFTCALCVETLTNVTSESLHEFPPNFSFGAATAAYQIEGGWDADGKGPSTWDIEVHTRAEDIVDGTNGDVVADSYHLFDLDLEIIKKLGIKHYRFSISWSRVTPTGDVSSLNQAAVKYYNMVIDKLIANNIVPMVTMFHFDLPHELQKLGGVLNPLFENYFEAYAGLLFDLFGDRVKFWLTINEPRLYCELSYGTGYFAPNIESPGVGEYLCGHHILKGHTAAYRLYQDKYHKKFGGKIGIPLDVFVYYKNNETVINDRVMQYYVGWFAHPLFSEKGGYPEVMQNDIHRNSLEEGRLRSRLPKLDEAWTTIMRGASDFLGVNYYTARYSKPTTKSYNIKSPSFKQDVGIDEYLDPAWQEGVGTWLYSMPQAMRDVLRWIKEQYGDIEIIITENGWGDGGEINDADRIDYLQKHLSEVLKAIDLDGCNISGYTYWSLIDSFEWRFGLTTPFGLYSVNFTSPTKERSPKKSAHFYKSIIQNHRIP